MRKKKIVEIQTQSLAEKVQLQENCLRQEISDLRDVNHELIFKLKRKVSTIRSEEEKNAANLYKPELESYKNTIKGLRNTLDEAKCANESLVRQCQDLLKEKNKWQETDVKNSILERMLAEGNCSKK